MAAFFSNTLQWQTRRQMALIFDQCQNHLKLVCLCGAKDMG